MKKFIFSWSYYNLGNEVVFAETEEKAREISFDTLREIALFSVRTKIQEKFMAKNATYIESWKF